MTAAGVFSLLPLFLSFPVSTHKKAGKLRLLKLSNEEITTLCSFSKRSCPFKYQSWKLSIYPFIIFTKDLCQFRAAKLCEISVIRTGNNIHPIGALFPGIEYILKATGFSKHLPADRIPEAIKKLLIPGIFIIFASFSPMADVFAIAEFSMIL